jgi:hypothetical protein
MSSWVKVLGMGLSRSAEMVLGAREWDWGWACAVGEERYSGGGGAGAGAEVGWWECTCGSR